MRPGARWFVNIRVSQIRGEGPFWGPCKTLKYLAEDAILLSLVSFVVSEGFCKAHLISRYPACLAVS